MTEDPLQKRLEEALKVFKFKGAFKQVLLTTNTNNYGDIGIQFYWTVPCVMDGEKTTIRSFSTYTPDFIERLLNNSEELAEMVFSLFTKLVSHEADEAFWVGDKQLRDPHPKPRSASGGT